MNKKIKILYTSEFGGLNGGGQQSILLLLDCLNRDKYQPALVSREGGDLLTEAQARGIFTTVKAPYCLRSMNVIQIWRTFKSLKKLVKDQEINLIHTDSPRWTFYFGVIAKSLKIPLVYHARVSMPEPGLYEKVIYSMSTKVIAVSNFSKKRFEGFSKVDQKVDVIYNAVDTRKFNPQCDGSRVRREFGIDGEVLIGMIGQMTPNKGHKEFLQAAAKVVEDLPDIKFVIVGEDKDDYKSELERLIQKLSLEQFVRLCAPRQDMPETMAALDVLVNASHLEGFSRVIIEAMALGKVIIATDVGGNPEAVQDNVTGILISPKNPGQLAQAILILGKDEQRRRDMGLAARKRAEDCFSVGAQIKRIENIYGQLAG